jgi:hypothetical protein
VKKGVEGTSAYGSRRNGSNRTENLLAKLAIGRAY